jgi:hypothetical protein
MPASGWDESGSHEPVSFVSLVVRPEVFANLKEAGRNGIPCVTLCPFG